MIMLMETVPAVKSGLMQKQAISVEKQVVLRMKVMTMTVPIPVKPRAWQIKRSKNRVIELLRKLRINSICLKQGFPYPEWFEGYRRPDGYEFIKRYLGEIAVMRAMKHDSVYVYMKRNDRSCVKALSDMCQGFRHILLSGQGLDAADSLYRKYGASVIVYPTPERILTADAAVFFDMPYEMPLFKEECAVVKAYEDLNVEFCYADGEELDIPDGYPQNALISEAILRGCIRFDDIHIIKTKISP